VVVGDGDPDAPTAGSGTLRRLAHEGIMPRSNPGETAT